MTVDATNPGESLFSLNPLNDGIIEKIENLISQKGFSYLNSSILPRSLFSIESDFVENNPDKVRDYHYDDDLNDDEIKLFCNDKSGKAGRGRWYIVKRSIITSGTEHINRWQVTVSSANAGGQKRSNQIDIVDDRSAFGRSRVALRSFKTKEEAVNFFKYCNSELIKFTFLLTDEALTSLAKKVPDILNYTNNNKIINFEGNVNAQLYSLFQIDDTEQKHIKTVLGLKNSDWQDEFSEDLKS